MLRCVVWTVVLIVGAESVVWPTVMFAGSEVCCLASSYVCMY